MNAPDRRNSKPQGRSTEEQRLGWLVENVVALALPKNRREEFLGDLFEEWSTAIVPRIGPTRARLWLWGQVMGSVCAILGFRLRGAPLADVLLAGIAVALGAFFVYVDTRPNWDDAGILVFSILGSCGFLGALAPRHPWIWALCVGAWLPLYHIVLGDGFAFILLLAFPFAGAYAGMVLRRMLMPEV